MVLQLFSLSLSLALYHILYSHHPTLTNYIHEWHIHDTGLRSTSAVADSNGEWSKTPMKAFSCWIKSRICYLWQQSSLYVQYLHEQNTMYRWLDLCLTEHMLRCTLYIENKLPFCFTYCTLILAWAMSLIIVCIHYTLLLCVYLYIIVDVQLKMNPDIQNGWYYISMVTVKFCAADNRRSLLLMTFRGTKSAQSWGGWCLWCPLGVSLV